MVRQDELVVRRVSRGMWCSVVDSGSILAASFYLEHHQKANAILALVASCNVKETKEREREKDS